MSIRVASTTANLAGRAAISQAIGANIAPVAAADSEGRVWIAWQGWRNGRASISVSRQEQDKFSEPFQVSESQANEWDPAIAADSKGHVALVWDSIEMGITTWTRASQWP